MNQIFEALGIENKEKIMKVLSSLDNKSKNKIIKDVKLKNTMKKLLEVDKNINKLNTNFLNENTVKIFNSFKENLGFLQSLYIYKNIEVNSFIQNLLNLINLKITLMGSMNNSNNNNNKDFKIVDLNKKELLALNNLEDTTEENNMLALADTTEENNMLALADTTEENNLPGLADTTEENNLPGLADTPDNTPENTTTELPQPISGPPMQIINDIDAKDKAAKDKAAKDKAAKDKDAKDKAAKDKAAKNKAAKDQAAKNKIDEDKRIMTNTKKILEDYQMINYNTSDQTFLNNRILEILNNMIKLLKEKLLNGHGNLGINHIRYEVRMESVKNVEKMLKLLESIKNGGVYPDYNKIKNLEQVIENVVPELRWYREIRSSSVNNSVRFYRWHMEIKSILKRLNDLKNNDSKEEDTREKNNKYNYYEKYLKYKSKYLKLKK